MKFTVLRTFEPVVVYIYGCILFFIESHTDFASHNVIYYVFNTNFDSVVIMALL